MKNTILILQDKIAVMNTKGSYEVFHDLLNMTVSPLKPLSIEEVLVYINRLEKRYMDSFREIVEKEPKKSRQKTIEEEITDAKKI